MTTTHHDILEAASNGKVGKAVCGYYGAQPKTILSLINRGFLTPTYPAVGEVKYRLTDKGMQELRGL